MMAEEGGAVVRETATAAGPWWRRAHWGALLVVGVVLASSATGLGNGFAYDDVVMIEGNPSVVQLQSVGHYLSTPYWGWGGGGSLYRPWAEGMWALQWAAGSGAPAVFHAVNVALYLTISWQVLQLARCFLRPPAALVVGLLWAAHPVHVEAVANGVGQAELWSALGLLTAALSFIGALAAARLTLASVFGVSLGVLCALFSKESGIVAPALLTTMWWVHPGRGGWSAGFRRRVGLLLRSTWYVAGIYFVVRLIVLGRLTGDEPHFALADLSTVERVWAALGFVPTYVRLFVWPFALYADYSPPFAPVHTTPGLPHVWALVLLLPAVGVALRWLRARHTHAVPVAWVMVTMLPVSNLLFPTGILVAERTLLIPSIGFLIAMGLVGESAWRAYHPRVGRFTIAVLGLGVATLLVAFISRSASRQRDWRDTPTLFAASYVDSPPNFRLERAVGGMLLRAGRVREAEEHLRAADALVPNDHLVLFGLGRALYRQGRCDEAIDVLVRVPLRAPLLSAPLTRVACLYRSGRIGDGRRVIRDALAAGLEPQPFRIMARTGDSVLALGPAGSTAPLMYDVDDDGAIRRLLPPVGAAETRGTARPAGGVAGRSGNR